MDLHNLASFLLDHSCSNLSEEYPGWNEYNIELHCAEVLVIARKQENKWEIKEYKRL